MVALIVTHPNRDNAAASMRTAATAIREALDAEDDPRWILALALEARDRCRDAVDTDPSLADSWRARPDTGDVHWDTLLTALVQHELGDAGKSAGSERDLASIKPLSPAWTPAVSAWRTFDESREQTPPWLARYGVVLAARDLETR